MSETREYVSVNEKEFGQDKTLELTVNGRILDNNLKQIVQAKVDGLNAKLNAKYDASVMDDGDENIDGAEKARLASQLKEVVRGFNELIATMEDKYIGETEKKQSEIRTVVSAYFTDKSLFVEQGKGFASTLKGYAGMNASDAAPVRAKELSLK